MYLFIVFGIRFEFFIIISISFKLIRNMLDLTTAFSYFGEGGSVGSVGIGYADDISDLLTEPAA